MAWLLKAYRAGEKVDGWAGYRDEGKTDGLMNDG
jgi:hypothetical protein